MSWNGLEKTSDPVFRRAGFIIGCHVMAGFHFQHIFYRHFSHPGMYLSRKIFREIIANFILKANSSLRYQKANSQRGIAFGL